MGHNLWSRMRISDGVRNSARTEEHRERMRKRALFSLQCRKLATEGVPRGWLTLSEQSERVSLTN